MVAHCVEILGVSVAAPSLSVVPASNKRETQIHLTQRTPGVECSDFAGREDETKGLLVLPVDLTGRRWP